MTALLPSRHGTPTAWHRAMAASDLAGVLALERAAYPFPWSQGNFIDSLAAGYLAWVRHDSQLQLVAYCVAQPGYQETHLLNLTVAPPQQRRGHGRALLLALAGWARARGDAALWLEVRQSNAGGRALYAGAGFAEVGLRRGYYPDAQQQREDAVVMRLALRDAAPGAGDALD
ncbi:MAG: ribosomal protein S18-alanine N-acetyltransferase [Aquabacterium sp.]|nr:ribosomal protein S18-alanine N-acetyltransferase [Aquabacterium sp.]